MSKFYFHGMGDPYGITCIKKCLDILKTGEIQCKRLLGYDERFRYTCNGMDYVSICKKTKNPPFPEGYDNAFNSYVQNCFCFIISPDIEAIKTVAIPVLCWNWEKIERLQKETNNRYSDMYDEWQVFEKIPLSYVVGVGIPCQRLSSRDWKMFPENLKRVKHILSICQSLGFDIVDSTDPDFVEKYEKQKQESSLKVYQISRDLEEVLVHE